ncbi:M3 family oligoendopeptidase [Clostridium sp. YIM B02515]|uniref:M3 family oligoendopeptidase n=1 Tax=Clostridium rhizosphaerae TaxID=2803861 RepID=A0ABS1T918_9CLOT|nr:M3 family oligoendopeptidase [Clostridium rhizosphaerae]MBL4935822.1 M3 family oligoendopeptidase [Clostridium rhizosphaerae]
MNMRWSLEELYTSFESDKFIEDVAKYDKCINNLRKWASDNLKDVNRAAEKIEEYIKMKSEFYSLYVKLSDYSELTLSVDAKNEKAAAASEEVDNKFTELTEVDVNFEKWLAALGDFEEILNSSDIIKEHEFYLKELMERNKYLLSEKEEIVVAKMMNTGSNAWSKLQNTVTSNLLVDIAIKDEEKKLPLPVVRNMAYSNDAETRKTAYEAELKAYKKIEEASAAALNGIKGEVITVSKLRGYESPLEETLIKSRLDRETLEAMVTAMKESLPSFRKFYLKKAEKLGHKNGLPFYDLFAPTGESDMRFTYEEARDFVVKNFRTFSNKLADFADNAFEKRWIDAETREGKRGGAFCSNIHPIGESRIMSNFTGSFSDVATLAHELGHGYHGSCLMEESYLNSRYTMPIAETASIFCETIVKNAALKNASKEEAYTILEGDISDSAQVIVDIYSRYLFETELFKRREKASLSVNELKEIMLKAQKEAYGEGLDENYLHPYMWVCKPHYYYAGQNFYNFPYAFGLLFSKGLYAEYLRRGESFVDDYDKLLSVTGKNKIADVTALMDVDIHSVDFWRSSLKLIEKDIEKFINL